MTDSPYAQVAASLDAMGFEPLPIMPGTKVPGTFENGKWRKRGGWSVDAITSANIADQSTWPDAGVCVRMTVSEPGVQMVGIDLDDEDYLDTLRSILPASIVARIGRKGRCDFYRCSSEVTPRAISAGKTRVIDVLGVGAQAVIPPTVHPDTQAPYMWLTEATLMDVTIHDLPEITIEQIEAITEAIKARYQSMAPSPGEQMHFDASGGEDRDYGGDTVHRRLNNTALANLKKWVPQLDLYGLRHKPYTGGYEAVPTWRQSHSGRQQHERGRNLKIHPTGIRDFGSQQDYTPLDLVMQVKNMPLDEAFSWLALTMKFEALPEITIAEKTDAVPSYDERTKEEIREDIAEAPSASAYAAATPMPAIVTPEQFLTDPFSNQAIVHVGDIPGMVGEIASQLQMATDRPMHGFAIAGALSIVGTLMGRNIVGPTRSTTNLYYICLATMGVGKDYYLQTVTRIIEDAGLVNFVGTAAPGSDAGLAHQIARSPNRLMVLDEMSKHLGKWFAPRAASHLEGIRTVLLKAWSASDTWATDESLKNKSITIRNSNFSILAASTPQDFQQKLKSSSILADGFFSRMTIIQDGIPHSAEATKSREDVIATCARIVRHRWMQFDEDQRRQAFKPDRPKMREMTWDGGVNHLRALKLWAENRLIDDEDEAPYLGRLYEQCVRIASIIAWGDGRMHVMQSDAQIAMDWLFASMRIGRDLCEQISMGEHDKWGRIDLHSKVLKQLKKSGGYMPATVVMRLCLQGEQDPMKMLKRMAEMDMVVLGPINGVTHVCLPEMVKKKD